MSDQQFAPMEPFQKSEIALLISDRSRQGHEWGEGFDVEERRAFAYFRMVGGEDKWDDMIERAVGAGAKLVAVAGGDGSLRLAAPALIKHQVVLGIIPSGTGNALAREIGMNLQLQGALDQILSKGHIESIDVGEVNGEIFLTVATLGLTSSIQKELSRLPKAELGIAAYVPAVLRALTNAHPFHITVEAGDKKFEGTAHQCVVGVGSKHGGFFSIAPSATRIDGLYHIYVVQATGFGGLGAYALHLVTDTLGDSGLLWTASAKEVSIKVRRKRSFIIDGDAYKWDHAEGHIKAGALRVWVPGPN